MNFKKYGSINNLSTKNFLDNARSCFPTITKKDFVVLEKAHGAHFSFQTNGETAACGKRNSILTDEDKFHNHSETLAKNLSKILDVFRLVDEKFKDVKTVQIDGELIGGSYPHADVKQLDVSRIQKGIYYCPDHKFYAYDIKYCDKNDKWQYINYDICMDIFFELKFFYAVPLKRGAFKDVIGFDPTFQTTLPDKFGLPPIKGNIAEGVVLKPVEPLYLPTGSRVIFKNKTTKFSETKIKTTRTFVLKDLPPQVQEVQDGMFPMITLNRLYNVISKIGEVTEKDMGKLIGLLSRDVLEEYKKVYGDKLEDLKKDRKMVTKALAKQCKMVVLKYYEDKD